MLTANKQKMVLGIFLGFLFVLSSFSTPALAEEIPLAAEVAAQEGLLPFLKAIPPEELGYFNFADQAEVDQSQLGAPFMIYTISPHEILNYKAGTDVESIIAPTDVWLFPVVSKGKSRTLLTVEFVDKNWRAVSIGGSGVAKQWESITGNSSEGGASNYKFVRVYQAVADFVLISDFEKTKVVPLESARISLEQELKLDEKGPYDPSRIILGLQEPVRQNMEAFNETK